MSAIVGYLDAKSLETNHKLTIHKMLSVQKHRGPDGEYLTSDDKNFSFGQNLLTINGSPLDNPIFKSGSCYVNANGRIYNFQELRAQLELEGIKFTTKNDNEVLLPLYRKYGLDFLNKLNGDFSMALIDEEKKKLYLIRDRFGVKPLFFHTNGHAIYFSSEVKGILQAPGVNARLSSEAILHQLMQTMIAGSSAFKDIYAVKPGHFLEIDYAKGRLEIQEKKYWDLDFPTLEERSQQTKDSLHYIGEVREKLANAVDLRLKGDQRVCSYLSGGIDSCSILGLISSFSQKPIPSFTIGFDHESYDETSIATEMAKMVGSQQMVVNLAAKELYGHNYVDTVWHAERTFYNTLGVAKHQMSSVVTSQGYRVALTGEGSDELFGGYPSFKRDLLLYSPESEESVALRKQMDSSNKLFTGAILSEDLLSHDAFNEVLGFTPSWIQPWMKTLELARPLLHKNIQEELMDYDPIASIAQSFDSSKIDGRHVLDKAQYTWSKTMLESQILNWGGDRVDMANGLESRPPFLDKELVAMALDIPPAYRIKGNVEKWVLKEAMQHIIPETLYKREKFAFMAPPAHTNKAKTEQRNLLFNQYLSEDKIIKAGIFDLEKMNAFIKTVQQEQDPVLQVRQDALVNHILGLQILSDLYIK